MRQVRGGIVTETVPSGGQSFLRREDASLPATEVVDTHQSSNHVARGLSMRGDSKPVVQRAALVRLEVAPTDPTYLCWIDYPGHTFAHLAKHATESRMEQQGFLILDEKMAELQVDLWVKYANAVDIRCDLVNLCHGFLPSSGGKL